MNSKSRYRLVQVVISPLSLYWHIYKYKYNFTVMATQQCLYWETESDLNRLIDCLQIVSDKQFIKREISFQILFLLHYITLLIFGAYRFNWPIRSLMQLENVCCVERQFTALCILCNSLWSYGNNCKTDICLFIFYIAYQVQFLAQHIILRCGFCFMTII